MSPGRTVAIARYPSIGDDSGDWVVVGVDVIRATTTAVTAVAGGGRCFPVRSLEEALPLAARLTRPLLAGELGGNKPYGFELQNSPVEMARRVDVQRPVILLSTTGTRMVCEAADRHRTFVACLRNVRAQADYLAASLHDRVLLVAGESRGELREEDRLCCGRLGRALQERGFAPHDAFAQEMIRDWGEAPLATIAAGHSAEYLAATAQTHDLTFILEHVDDLAAVYELRGGEVVEIPV